MARLGLHRCQELQGAAGPADLSQPPALCPSLNAQPRIWKPQVLGPQGGTLHLWMRGRQGDRAKPQGQMGTGWHAPGPRQRLLLSNRGRSLVALPVSQILPVAGPLKELGRTRGTSE